MPTSGSARQRTKWLTDIEREVLALAIQTHLHFGSQYLRSGEMLLASFEAESARRAVLRLQRMSA